MNKLSVDDLAKLLHDAEDAHGEYEKGLGHRDEDWPHWYADYILKQVPLVRGD